jgi:hypothetical protein
VRSRTGDKGCALITSENALPIATVMNIALTSTRINHAIFPHSVADNDSKIARFGRDARAFHRRAQTRVELWMSALGQTLVGFVPVGDIDTDDWGDATTHVIVICSRHLQGQTALNAVVAATRSFSKYSSGCCESHSIIRP